MELLKKLNYGSISYRTPKGVFTKNLKGVSDELGYKAVKTGKDLRNTWEELIKPPEVKVTEEGSAGPKIVNEEREALISMLDTMSGGGRYHSIQRVARTMETFLASSSRKEKVREWFTAYRKAGELVDSMTPADTGYTEALRKFRQTGTDIQKTFRVLHMMKSGGLDFSESKIGQFMDNMELLGAVELLNIIKDQASVPYNSFGGYNITSIYNSYERDMKTILFREIKAAGGQTLLDMANKGLLDEDLYKIKHYMEEKLSKKTGDKIKDVPEQSGGVKGTLAEDTRQNLEVSDSAWKVYDCLLYTSPSPRD